MFIVGKTASLHILAVRLGAMGDIIHALPAAASLKLAHPDCHLTWLVEPKWAPLLDANPFVDRVLDLHRESLAGLFESWRALSEIRCDYAVDFQGLLKSALAASAARPGRLYGFDPAQIRERSAALFYTHRIFAHSPHVVDRNLELAAALPAGAASPASPASFPLPPGTPEGDLPSGDFVLASPLAGWASKQWPLDHYRALAARLLAECGIPLVLNGPPGAAFHHVEPALVHYSGLAGLIYATRRAAAVVGVDSGPLHLAAALSKPGVAIFGPTDPARNGPYGNSLHVLRSPSAGTTYKRGDTIDPSMQLVSPDQVFDILNATLSRFAGFART
jgi:heptosyltransferase-1